MATCKDCVHYDACTDWIPPRELLQAIKPEGCNKFKNKADFVEVKHGKWTSIGLKNPQCSLCHKYNYEESRFCPNCGTKMDLEEGAET